MGRNKIQILMLFFNICFKQENAALQILFFTNLSFVGSQGKIKKFQWIFISFITVKRGVEKTCQSTKPG